MDIFFVVQKTKVQLDDIAKRDGRGKQNKRKKLVVINRPRFTHSLSLTNRHLIKSLASSEMSAKASWSKSYLAIVTFAIVSISVSPINGDRPDKLRENPMNRKITRRRYLILSMKIMIYYLQYVTDNSDTPHIRPVTNLIEIHHFRCNEFRSAK